MAVKIDLHVHTSRYSECAEFLDIEKVEDHASSKKIDALVITDHDYFWEPDEFEALRKKFQRLKIFRGIEVSSGWGCHFVVIGIQEPGPLEKGVSNEVLLEYVHSQGGVVTLAHPFQMEMPEPSILRQVDAMEIVSTSFNARETQMSKDLAKKYQKPMIGCSDAHALAVVGYAHTEFPFMPANEAELAEMIRSGQGVPCHVTLG